jgi:hypothetical protein
VETPEVAGAGATAQARTPVQELAEKALRQLVAAPEVKPGDNPREFLRDAVSKVKIDSETGQRVEEKTQTPEEKRPPISLRKRKPIKPLPQKSPKASRNQRPKKNSKPKSKRPKPRKRKKTSSRQSRTRSIKVAQFPRRNWRKR